MKDLLKFLWIIIFSHFVSCASIKIFNTDEIEPLKAYSLLNSRKAEVIFVDLRSDEEYKKAHIEGAVNIDYFSPSYKERLSQLSKDRLLILYCKHGLRSKNAVKTLKSMGYHKALSLKGGISQWIKAGLPVRSMQSESR